MQAILKSPSSAQVTLLFQPACRWNYRHSMHTSPHQRQWQNFNWNYQCAQENNNLSSVSLLRQSQQWTCPVSNNEPLVLWMAEIEQRQAHAAMNRSAASPLRVTAPPSSPGPQEQPSSTAKWLQSSVWASGECVVKTWKGPWTFNMSQILATKRTCDYCWFGNSPPNSQNLQHGVGAVAHPLRASVALAENGASIHIIPWWLPTI